MSFRVKVLALVAAGSIGAMTYANGYLDTWEGNKLKSYKDIVGVWTACRGITEGIGPNMTFTPEECREKNNAEVMKYAKTLDDMVRVEMTEIRKGALISWIYNVGPTAARNSTLIKKLNAGNTIGACMELVYGGRKIEGWIYAGGKPSRGLLNRRIDEMYGCMQGTYE